MIWGSEFGTSITPSCYEHGPFWGDDVIYGGQQEYVCFTDFLRLLIPDLLWETGGSPVLDGGNLNSQGSEVGSRSMGN